MTSKKFIVTTWNDGKHDTRGNGYGIRIGKKNRSLFEKSWDTIELSIEGSEFFKVNITPGFWRNCTELRNKKVGKWFIQLNLAPWKKGDTPKFYSTKMEENKFLLERKQ